LAVGQDEDALPLVGRANFSRAEYAPRRSVTDSIQLFDDVAESETDVALDVLEETKLGSHEDNSICDPRPEVTGVVLAEALAGCTEWLTRISTTDDIHSVSKAFPREGLKVRPDRCRVHESRFHFCDQVRSGKGFDLTNSDCAQTFDCSSESEINAAVPCTEANVCNDFGIIHVMLFY
jgi:hypothetical protein